MSKSLNSNVKTIARQVAQFTEGLLAEQLADSATVQGADLGKFLPLMTVKAYAEAQKMSVRTVYSQIAEGHIPTIKKGRYVYINLVAMGQVARTQAAAEAAIH